VVAVSFAAILIRKADAPAMVIAAYRMGIAALVVAPTATALGGWRHLPKPRDLLLCVAASAFLAVHFVGWISSLQYTSVASSVVLVTATPLMVALASRMFLKEPLKRRVLMGIALGLAGSIVIAAGDLASAGRDNLLGDALALLGAIAMTGYLLIGRRVRQRVPILPYLTLVYVGAALLLLAGTGIAGASLSGYSGQTYLFLVLLALVPQLLGHSLLNWSLARVTATLVSIAVMAEPVVSTILALALLHESPPITSYLGGVVILTGIYLSTRRPRGRKRVPG
jgi:drug/metabolite transporter (DMT)-like permease